MMYAIVTMIRNDLEPYARPQAPKRRPPARLQEASDLLILLLSRHSSSSCSLQAFLNPILCRFTDVAVTVHVLSFLLRIKGKCQRVTNDL